MLLWYLQVFTSEKLWINFFYHSLEVTIKIIPWKTTKDKLACFVVLASGAYNLVIQSSPVNTRFEVERVLFITRNLGPSVRAWGTFWDINLSFALSAEGCSNILKIF